jgi:hypothetical protein
MRIAILLVLLALPACLPIGAIGQLVTFGIEVSKGGN